MRVTKVSFARVEDELGYTWRRPEHNFRSANYHPTRETEQVLNHSSTNWDVSFDLPTEERTSTVFSLRRSAQMLRA